MHKPLLAIETTGTYCSVALVDGDNQVFLQTERKRSHADELLSLINASLDQAALTLPECAAIAVNVGPGSFTGIRIGIAVAQGLAFGAEISTCAVSALQAMVFQANAATNESLSQQSISTQSNHAPRIWASLLHAREDEFYFGEYRLNALGCPVLTGKESVILAADLESWLKEKLRENSDPENIVLVGEGWLNIALPDALAASVRPVSIDARTIAELARFQLYDKQTLDPANLVPSYLKDEMHYRTVKDDNPPA
jgi:tRNA threonylcarbamoyladenosine biosynthesis protein TsaB